MSFRLRDYQVEPADRLESLLREFPAAADFSDMGCHAKGTLILMFDGRVKPVEDIQVGDVLQGPDSTPRQVLSLRRGRQKMVRVTPVKGDPFVVNRGHILTLVDSDIRKGRNRVVDIPIDQFRGLPKTRQETLKLFRAPSKHWPEQVLEVDPYFLGVFLGDGRFNDGNFSISKPDVEILEECRKQASIWGASLTTVYHTPTNPSHFFRGTPALFQAFRRLGLGTTIAHNKEVPEQYLRASWDQRRELLAGLIDTDGSLDRSGVFDFISASKKLAESVVFLSRSLGLFASVRPCRKRCQTGSVGDYFRVGISGDCSSIPTRILRKQASPRRQVKNVLRTWFSLEDLPEDDFFGFSLSGDGRFLLGDFTVTHNTGKTFVASEIIRRRDKPTLVVCPKISISAWRDVGAMVGAEFDVVNWEKLRVGDSDYGRWDVYRRKKTSTRYVWNDIKWIRAGANDGSLPVEKSFSSEKALVEAYPKGAQGIFAVEGIREFKRFIWAKEVGDVFFDEAHMASGVTSQNANMLHTAVSQGKTVVPITATPAESPLQLRAIGYALGLHNNADFHFWCLRNGCYKHFGGLKFTDDKVRAKAIMDALNDQLDKRIIRIRIADLPAGSMPEVIFDAPLIDIDETAEIDRMHDELKEALREIEEKGLQGGAEDHPMTKALRARQRIELLHVPGYIDLANQRLDAGRSVLFFVNFSSTVAALSKAFPTFGIIDGAHTKSRTGDIAALQEDRIRGLICNQQAGGVSLSAQDLTGKHPRSSIISAVGCRAKDVKQCKGRTRRNGSMSIPEILIPVAAGTCEEKIHKRIAQREICIETLVDGDLDL